MQSLATPIVAVAEQAGAYLFTREHVSGGGVGFAARSVALAELPRLRPGSVFETGRRWQMVPSKLYRYDDRASYLRERYPQVAAERIGVLPLPSLGAMALFDRSAAVADNLYSGNHLVELLLDGVLDAAPATDTYALAYFVEEAMWLVLVRDGRVYVVDSHPCRSGADAVFFAGAQYRQYALERAECPLVVGGSIGDGSQLRRDLEVYFDVRDLAADLLGPTAARERTAASRLLLAYEHAQRSIPHAPPAAAAAPVAS